MAEKTKYGHWTQIPEFLTTEGVKDLAQANEFQDIANQAKLKMFVEKDFAWAVFSSKYYYERHSKRWIPRVPGRAMLPENKDRFVKNICGVITEVIRQKKTPWMYEYVDVAIQALTQLREKIKEIESEMKIPGTPDSPIEVEEVVEIDSKKVERRPIKEKEVSE